MAGYNHPCRHCGVLIPPDSNTCPMCGKVNPLSIRCPQCHSPVQKTWQACNSCGLKLHITCPACQETIFFDDYCQKCGARLAVTCPNPKCRFEQPILGPTCKKCGKPLN